MEREEQELHRVGQMGPRKKSQREVGMGSWKVEWGNETEGDSGEAEEIRERT